MSKTIKEIGSDFWDIPISAEDNKLFNNVTWYISGRSALRAIIKQIKAEHHLDTLKVALPSFLCETMIMPLDIEKIDYSFYNVSFNNHELSFDFSNTNDCNVVLVLDYFGYESKVKYDFNNKIVIRDLTHSVFIKKYNDADYYFGSLRKWAGFIGAGFAYSKNGPLLNSPEYKENDFFDIKKQAINIKADYISGHIASKEYLPLFLKAEKMLDKCDIESCDKKDIESAKRLDVDLIKKTRRENALVLINGLKDHCVFDCLSENDCPLCVPILYKNRDELREFLISRNIYCPVHWPKPSQINDCSSQYLYENELSLVCDQRYKKEDMLEVVKAIKEFVENDKNA